MRRVYSPLQPPGGSISTSVKISSSLGCWKTTLWKRFLMLWYDVIIYNKRKNSQYFDENQERYKLAVDRTPGYWDIQKVKKFFTIYLNISRRGYKCTWMKAEQIATSGELTDIYLSPDRSVACNVWNYQGMESWTDQYDAVSAFSMGDILSTGEPFRLNATIWRPSLHSPCCLLDDIFYHSGNKSTFLCHPMQYLIRKANYKNKNDIAVYFCPKMRLTL